MKPATWNRRLHRWAAVFIALPFLVILLSGVLLQLKKNWGWVQPPTQTGSTTQVTLSWEQILEIARRVPEAGVTSWDDIDRLDVRPGRGMLKIRCKNGWELQIDAEGGEILSSSRRRSDLIESIHDGSWFHSWAKLGLFLPTALIIIGLWCTGVYLWLLPHRVKRRRRTSMAPSRGS